MVLDFKGHRGVERRNGTDEASWETIICGHCGRDVSAAVLIDRRETYRTVQWLQCPTCGEASVRSVGGPIYQYPGPLVGPVIEGLPEDVASAYEEARRCMSVNAFTACEGLCRKILMHVGVEKGAKEGAKFVVHIEHLEKAGYVTPPMKPWVDLIRKNSNESQHYLPPPSPERAEGTLMFTAELLRLTYEMQHMAEKYAPTKKAGESTQ